MNTERPCEFHGGPIHGKEYSVFDDQNLVNVYIANSEHLLEMHNSDAEPSMEVIAETVRYTRIFNGRTPTNHFEYIGREI